MIEDSRHRFKDLVSIKLRVKIHPIFIERGDLMLVGQNL